MGNLDILEEACARIPHTTRAMFGGHGLFAPNGGMFAGIGDEDRIILKLDDERAVAEFRELGGEPWTYQGRMTMSRWFVVPDALYDDPVRLEAWARRAYALARPAKPRNASGKGAKAGARGGGRSGAGASDRKRPR